MHSLLQKSATGIKGFDAITHGGIPKNRPTLLCGGPGSGKSMFGMEFLIHGVELYNEPGMFIAFEENEIELIQNSFSVGYDVKSFIDNKLLVLEHIKVDRSELTETGNYNLEGLFIRLNYLIDKYKIKRVVLDTIEVLFSNLNNDLIIRSELQRLFRWFKNKKVTAIITAERGNNKLSRYGLEEYVADCVISLDHRIDDQISTRRLRIIKYRGSSHGCNEYPFIITSHGFYIAAITTFKLDFKVNSKRISTGIPQFDTLLSGKGFYAGSSILLTGPAGIGKSSFSAAFINAACQRGEKCLYFALEESVDQVVRNMNSININLRKWIRKGLLKFHSINPNADGLESHMVDIQLLTNEFEPKIVVIDPVSNLKRVGRMGEVEDMLALLIWFFKKKGITTLFTSLAIERSAENRYVNSDEHISSSMDTWVYLSYIYEDNERHRALRILKSRGMAHSSHIHKINLSKAGIFLEDVPTQLKKKMKDEISSVKPSKKPGKIVKPASKKKIKGYK